MNAAGVEITQIGAVLVAEIGHATSREAPEGTASLRAVHERIHGLLPRENLELVVEARRIRIVVLASQIAALLKIACEMQKRTWREPPDALDGPQLAIGISSGPLNQLSGADACVHWDGNPIDDAIALAAEANLGAIFLDRVARDTVDSADERSVRGRRFVFGPPLVVGADANHPRLAAFELVWGEAPLGPRRRRDQPRRRGRLQRWQPKSEHGFVRTPEGDYYYTDRRFITGALEPAIDTPVFFIPKAPLQAGKNPVASAVVAVDDRLQGEVVRIGNDKRATIRVADRVGNTQDLFAADRGNEELRQHEKVSFIVAEAKGEPVAIAIEPLDEEEPEGDYRAADEGVSAVTERFLVALMDELARNGARGAAAAVRRVTRTRPAPLSQGQTAERQRMFDLLEHGRRHWAQRALTAVGQPALAARLANLEAITGPAQADYLQRELGGCLRELKALPMPPTAPSIRPVLIQLKDAAFQASRVGARESVLDLTVEAPRLTVLHAGQACAHAFLSGVITAIPPEAEAVAAKLDGLQAGQPTAAVTPEEMRARLVESLRASDRIAVGELLRREQNRFEVGVMTCLQQAGDKLNFNAAPERLKPIEAELWTLVELRLATFLPLIEYDVDLFAAQLEELALFAETTVPTRSPLASWRQGHRWVVWMLVWSLGVAASSGGHWRAARLLWEIQTTEEGDAIPLAAMHQLGGWELGDHLTLARFGKRMPLDGLWHLGFRLSRSDLIREHYPRVLRSDIADAPLAFLSRAADWAWCLTALCGQAGLRVQTARYWEGSQVHAVLPAKIGVDARLRRRVAEQLFLVGAEQFQAGAQRWLNAAATVSP